MNSQLEEFARTKLKEGLRQCEEKNQVFFKRMYSHDDQTRSIDAVVDCMPVEKLDWAMQQVQSTIAKKKAKASDGMGTV